jgi:spermidine synthase
VYKVVDVLGGEFRVLFHGTTSHGSERERDAQGRPMATRPDPLAYYYRGGPFAEAIAAIRAGTDGKARHIALIGLGIGALSCYSKPGEQWDYYELDPLMAQIAANGHLFRSMTICAPRAAFILGDGRLALQRNTRPIDLLLIDAFTSDSVPVHLLTREAMALYKSRLSPHGFLVMNISNRNMELASIVAASAAANGMTVAVKRDRSRVDQQRTLRMAAEIAIVAKSQSDLVSLALNGWSPPAPRADVRVWTDDYSNVPAAIFRKLAGR